RENLETAAGKRAFSTAALAVIKELSDPVEQEHYIQVVASMTGASISAIRAKLDSTGKQEAKPLKPVTNKNPVLREREYTHLDTVLGAGLLYPGLRILFKDVAGE